MNFLKIFGLFLFIVILVVLETSFNIIPDGVSFTFILLSVLLINKSKKKYTEKKKMKFYLFFIALLSGFLLDIFSVFFPGLFTITFLILYYLSDNFLLNKFNFNSFLSIFVFSILIGLIYHGLVFLFALLSYLIGLSSLPIIINKFYLLITFQSIILNGILILFVIFVQSYLNFGKKKLKRL